MKLLVKRINWSGCHQWKMDETSLHHQSRRYFSVVFVRDQWRERMMIDQPEIGILGFLVAGNGPDRRWLVQLKSEPGNVGFVQIAPTVQATRSNYERVHGGRPTPFLAFFAESGKTGMDVLGSEQGDRFLNKFNRNCKRLVSEDSVLPEAGEQYCWLSNEELKSNLRKDYAVNTDARSVIASGSWHLLSGDPQRMFLDGGLDAELATSFHRSCSAVDGRQEAHALRLLARIYRDYPPSYRRVPLGQVRDHVLSEEGVFDAERRQVLGYFDCHMPDREVVHWQQPLVERDVVGLHVLLFRLDDGVARFNVAAYPEIGIHGRVEFGPSLQSGDTPFKLSTEVLLETLNDAEIILEIEQSDEGGRFNRNIGRYVIAHWHGDPEILNRENGCWLTAAELEQLSIKKGVLSNELRTLLSLLLSLA